MGVKEFFKLNVLKVVMGILLTIITFEIFMWNSNQFSGTYNTITTIILIIFCILIGYLISCVIDYFVKSRFIKILIAVILAIVAIIFGWFSLARNVMVCDPVHDPRVCDPVHQP